MDNKTELEITNPLLLILSQHKKSAFEWQERRHTDWLDNYSLYRDKVVINRLTQRQSVNVPLMKTSIKTALKDVDDPPMLFFESLDNDKDTEIVYNEYFNYCADYNKLNIKDIVDKKQVFLYGRSFKKLNIVNGKFYFEIIDPHDVLIDRYVDPSDIDTARYIVHQHIFTPLSSLSENEEYDKEAVNRLKEFMATEAGLIKADNNLQTVRKRNERMKAMGVPDVDSPLLGETYIELNEHYLKRWNDEEKEDQFWLIVTAQDREILLEKPLEDVIGETSDHFWRYHTLLNSWADDVERTDVWSDGVADTIRTPNKIANSMISQTVENRTLRNFGMNFYNATIEGFTPQTYEPEPGGWYGLPGKPSDVYERVDIPDLSDSLDELTFIIQLAEKASASTAIQQGATPERRITLGEVEILMANASERVKAMSVFYTQSWKEFGQKYVKLLEASSDKLDDVTLYKKGLFNDALYAKDAKPANWKKKAGYRVKILSLSEKQEEEMASLQKLNAVIQSIPGNAPLMDIYNKKLLEFGGLTPDEMKEVLDFEKQKAQAPAPDMAAPTGMPTEAPVPMQMGV
jgi:hypothetical protein